MTISANFPNVKPSLLLDFANTQQLPPSVTFTRATTAAYYNGSTTAMAEQNLFLYSQEFQNGYWSLVNSSVTANAGVAPDGTSTADKLIPSASNSGKGLYVHSGNASDNCTVSIFVKAVEYGFATVSFLPSTGGGFRYAVTINLSTGAVTQQDGLISGYSNAVTSIGSGWYRVSITSVNTSANQTILVSGCPTGTPTISAGVPEFTGDGTSGILIWGAQLEQRPVLTAYTATTSQAITNYIPVLLTAGGGQPRFDHNPTTSESLGLLIEEQRTNLLTYSSQFDDASWVTTNTSVTANTVVSPDGTLSGDKMNETAVTDKHYLYKAFTASATTYSASIYAKAAERSILYFDVSIAGDGAYFNLTTGTVSNISSGYTASMTSVGNGWYRCVITFTGTAATWYFQPGMALVAGTSSYAGVANNGIFIWGAQLEAEAFATSYIPTTSAAATRAADSALMTGNNFTSWFNNGEGMFYSEGQLNYNPIGAGGAEWLSANDGTQSNKIAPYFSSGSGILFSNIVASGVEQANTGATVISANVNFKYASTYKVNDFASVVNSGTVSTDASGVVPYRLSQLVIGDGSSIGNRSRYYKKLAYYPIRVTNAQLQALTS